MIVHITGVVSEVYEESVVLDRDGIGYEVLICGYAAGELRACRGQTVTLHTAEYYEGSTAGGNLIPRMVGFLHEEDRAFFNKFITVKGMGTRKTLKALTEPVASIAAAIESGDAKALTRLPGIGKRAADQIVAELKGKLADFVTGVPEDIHREVPEGQTWSSEQRDALEVMIALGERRNEAVRWIERATQLNPGTYQPDEWIRLAYRVKSNEG